MGYITTLTANNDLIHKLPTVDDLGDKILEAISQLPARIGKKPIPIGNSGMTAVESHHARDPELIVVGGDFTGRPLWGEHDDDAEGVSLEKHLLTRLAQKHGYKLVKKRKR